MRLTATSVRMRPTRSGLHPRRAQRHFSLGMGHLALFIGNAQGPMPNEKCSMRREIRSAVPPASSGRQTRAGARAGARARARAGGPEVPLARLRRVCSGAQRALVAALLFGPLSLLGAQGPGLLGENLLPGKPRGEIPPGFWEHNGFWVLLIGALVLAAACIAVWYLTRPKPVIAVPPEAEARRRLEELRQRPEDGAVLSAISQTLRRYLAAVFSLPPDQMTTSEFCRAIESHEQIGLDLCAAVGRLFRRWDEQKFAPAPSGPALNAAVEALAIIDLAEARLASLREATQKQPAGAQPAAADPKLVKEAR